MLREDLGPVEQSVLLLPISGLGFDLGRDVKLDQPSWREVLFDIQVDLGVSGWLFVVLLLCVVRVF